MAIFESEGIEDLDRQLKDIDSKLRDAIMPEMVNAGADVLIDEWRKSIQAHGHVRTGEMLSHVDKTKIKQQPDSTSIEVYPMGNASHRKTKTTNAQKAFILHHGRQANKNGRKGIVGDKFVTEAEQNAETKVSKAMQAVLDKYTSGKE